MKKFWSILFLLLINCAVSTAQSFHSHSLDLDTGANVVLNANFDKSTKNKVLTFSSLLWHKLDSFGRHKMVNHFVRLDSNSNVLLTQSYQKENINTRLLGNMKLKQGGYIAYGYEYNTKLQALGKKEVPGCIIYYNNNGDSLFTKYFYFNNGNSSIYSANQFADSSLILVSLISHQLNNFSALRITKLDTLFNVLFDSIYYYCDYNTPNLPQILSYFGAAQETDDGGLLVGSYIYTRNADTNNHALLFKINKLGVTEWERRYEFPVDDKTIITKIIKLKDGNYMILGYYQEFLKYPNIFDRIFLIKVNSNGVLISKKLIQAYMYHFIRDAIEKPNGDILLAGTFATSDNDAKSKAGLVCLNSRGDIKWHKQYELPNNKLNVNFEDSELTDIDLLENGNINAVGNLSYIDITIPYNSGYCQDIYFLYTDSNGCIDPSNCTFTTVEEELVMPNYFQVYPNPSRGYINFSTNISIASSAYIKIYNNLGQLLFEKEITNFTEEVDVSTLPKGLYILEIQSKEFRNTQKLLIE